MSYRLEWGESVSEGIKRIALEQIDSALEDLTHPGEDRHEAVHDARKRFKKTRAVLRLVRDEVGEDVYKKENVCFRNAGRQLAEVRDSFVRVETVDKVTGQFADELAGGVFKELRENLLRRHEEVTRQILDEQNSMADVARVIRAARARVEDWPIKKSNFSALESGLSRVYRRGRNRMPEAYSEGTAEALHEWRKRVKYLWYHMRLLSPLWPEMIEELADYLHELANLLGEEHDLAELSRLIQEEPSICPRDSKLETLLALIVQRRGELQAASRPLGERIYAEKPGEFVDRIASYWETWQEVSSRIAGKK